MLVLSGIALQLTRSYTAIVRAASCNGSKISGTTLRDYNANGQQDANEPGIIGIVVTVYAADGSSTTCTTTNQGLDQGDMRLALRDRDGDQFGKDVVSTILNPIESYHAASNNGIKWYNNHTYDFGFVQTSAPPSILDTPTPTGAPNATPIASPSPTPQPSATPPVFSIGNLVWFDADNNGFVDPGERGLAGVTVELYRADATATGEPQLLQTMTTNADGYYLFTNLKAGSYLVEVKPPVGYTSSTGGRYIDTEQGRFEAAPAPDSDATDNDDNGTTFDNVVRSGSVTLTLGHEPKGEPATPGLPDDTPDANANYTVDFGFFELPTRLGAKGEPQSGQKVFLPLVAR